jgi:hypothetical protein
MLYIVYQCQIRLMFLEFMLIQRAIDVFFGDDWMFMLMVFFFFKVQFKLYFVYWIELVTCQCIS